VYTTNQALTHNIINLPLAIDPEEESVNVTIEGLTEEMKFDEESNQIIFKGLPKG
jgi:hypothetical protein